MKNKIKMTFPNIVFTLIVMAVFSMNSFVSNKLDSFIPTYKEHVILHEDVKQLSINNDSFSYRYLLFDDKGVKFSAPEEKEYAAILKSDLYASLIKMIDKELGGVIKNDKKLLFEMQYNMVLGTDEHGEEKYYLYLGYDDRGLIKELLVAFNIDTGIEQYVCIDNIGGIRYEYSEVELNNFVRQKLADKAKEYIELISDMGLIKPLPELYFPIKYITGDGSICYIQDSTSQLTVYYDTINERAIGFRRNKQ